MFSSSVLLPIISKDLFQLPLGRAWTTVSSVVSAGPGLSGSAVDGNPEARAHGAGPSLAAGFSLSLEFKVSPLVLKVFQAAAPFRLVYRLLLKHFVYRSTSMSTAKSSRFLLFINRIYLILLLFTSKPGTTSALLKEVHACT